MTVVPTLSCNAVHNFGNVFSHKNKIYNVFFKINLLLNEHRQI